MPELTAAAFKQRELYDLSLAHNLVPDDMFHSWEKYGKWQRAVCDHFGGPKGKTILDIGCGPLRFGAFVLEDIGNGRFCGVEPFEPYAAIAEELIERLGKTGSATIIRSSKFEFPKDLRADFAMCHGVFTHLAAEEIRKCLENLAGVMKPGGVFIFTYNLSPSGKTVRRGRLYAEQFPIISDHLADESVFTDFCASRGLTFEPFTAIPHPAPQTVGVISFCV